MIRGRRFIGTLLASGISLLSGTGAARATFVVSSWELASIADNLTTGQFDIQASYTVENPFVQNLTASVSDHLFSSSNYNLSWDDSGGSFHLDLSQQAIETPPGGSYSRAGSFIFVQPTYDTILIASSSYGYALPPDEFSARLITFVRDTTTNQIIWGDDPDADSYGGSFVSGTLHADTPPGGIMLVGGHTFVLHDDFLLLTGGAGGTNEVGITSGSTQWTLTVVPECTSLSLLGLGGAWLTRRARRHQPS